MADVGGDQPFGLADDALWLVERGFVDVFIVIQRADGLGGARRLVRVDAGAMLAGLDAPRAPGAQLLAVATADTRLWRLQRSELWEASARAGSDDPDAMQRDAMRADVVALVDGWAAALAGGVTSEVPPRKCAEIAQTGSVELEAGSTVRPAVDVAWLRVDGTAHFAGRRSLQLATDVAYPVSGRLWITAAGACAVHAEDPATLGDALWTGLARLQALVVCAAVENATLAAQANHERLQRQAEESRSTYVGALHNLAGAMRLTAGTSNGAQTRARRPGPYDDLLRSMGRVADRAGVTITPPTTHSWVGVDEPVDAIARASHFQTRRVVLGGDWWQHDAGPLLGFIEGPTSREAVALLPLPTGGYRNAPAGG